MYDLESLSLSTVIFLVVQLGKAFLPRLRGGIALVTVLALSVGFAVMEALGDGSHLARTALLHAIYRGVAIAAQAVGVYGVVQQAQQSSAKQDAAKQDAATVTNTPAPAVPVQPEQRVLAGPSDDPMAAAHSTPLRAADLPEPSVMETTEEMARPAVTVPGPPPKVIGNKP